MFDKTINLPSGDPYPDSYPVDHSPVNVRAAGQRNAAQASAADPRGILRGVNFFPYRPPETSTCSFFPTSFSASFRKPSRPQEFP
jgi:hypothetical protein